MMKRIAYIFLLFCTMAVLMLCLLPLYRCAVPVQLVFTVQSEAPATLTVTPGMGTPVTVSVAAGEHRIAVPLTEKRVSAVELRHAGSAAQRPNQQRPPCCGGSLSGENDPLGGALVLRGCFFAGKKTFCPFERGLLGTAKSCGAGGAFRSLGASFTSPC